MKRSIAVLGLLVSLFALPVTASEAFILSIPIRGNPQQETGEVRVTLTLNAAPAGAQLVVSGNTTVNLGATQMVNGDSVSFATLTGNDIRITYKPLSNFTGDFCTAPAAVQKDIPMRFVGVQDVTDYRIATYIVASPMVECSQVSKHTGDTPATITPNADGVAPALVANDRGRDFFDVVLTLDKSGSMAGLPPDAASGATKVKILKSAVETFISQWRQIDAPVPTGQQWPHDRIANIFFDSAAAPQMLPGADPPANLFVQRGNSMPGGPWDAVITNVDTLTPGSSTSIGGGINEAMKQWKLDPQHDLTLIVVTDGMQNTAPLIAQTASGFLGLAPVSGLPQELRKRFIPIHTIGFGMPAAVDENLLRFTSFETSGVSYISVNATTMFDVFSQTLVALLKGNTASLGLRHNDTMIGKGPAAPQSLVVDRTPQRVMFTLQWAPPMSNVLDFDVVGPNGAAAVESSHEKTPQSVIRTFNLTPADAGTWQVQAKRDSTATATGALPNVPYSLNAIFLERHLDYTLHVDTIHPATGDQLGVRAVVAFDGKPLSGLPAGAIRARIQRPTEALGTILHDSKVSPGNGGPGPDIDPPYERKLAKLTDSKLVDRVIPKDVTTIALQDQGKGVYTGSFDQTSVAGEYGFEFILDWDVERTGHVHREERLEQDVKVKVDPVKTIISMQRKGSTVLVTVTPRDRFGNYLGPGYASLVSARVISGGTLSERGPLDKKVTGDYVFTITNVPADVTPRLEIVVDGVVVGAPTRASSQRK
jgi:hypothetical protein